jgi:hypothetical protein
MFAFLTIYDRTVFFAIAGVLFGYLLYQMIRKRKGLRKGNSVVEPEI